MSLNPYLFLPTALTLGWLGTRAARHIRRSKGTKADIALMLTVCWAPLLVWGLAILLSRFGSPS
ncbi:hypothetical protein GETHLI_20090 [Geothrix limicola]|uniref:Uncharacterized protein n=1 Tax=Geothrix limicola TaxID=2927978 RepID=A0ABQ5QFD0_9BACT|nr:hypothetical protein [Geothrix limicola]GLH73507.1 hypothetical protein GETHLI_20090 [Geothrix limicola]